MSDSPRVSVSTVGTDLVGAAVDAREDAVVHGVPAAILAKDASLWGPDAEPEAAKRLGWVDLPRTSEALLPRLAELKARFATAGLDHVVLAGMGGSSLAPEVIAATEGVELTTLDTTDAGQVRSALADRLDRTVLVVSSKSGGTVETDSHRRVYEQAFRDAGIDPAERIVVVTDPGSPLEKSAREAGYEVVEADPDVGGRYSALTAFGLVPSALAGVDVERLLADARAAHASLSSATDNPGLDLGAAMGGAGTHGRDKLIIADAGSGIVGFGDWAEQLVAESTGKLGTGLLPVVVESVTAPGFVDAGPDAHRVLLTSGDLASGAADGGGDELTTVSSSSLGAQFMVWELAVALAGRTIGINPFDQPNVEEAKAAARSLLDTLGSGTPAPEEPAAVTDGAVEVYGPAELLGGASTLAEALAAFLGHVPERGYLAVLAYLDRTTDLAAPQLRPALARRLGTQVTFGWGPRFLHSTGQYHKGGHANGAFLEVTGAVVADLEIPGRPYTFGGLQHAQAIGDLTVLRDKGRPAVRIHLLDRAEGLRALLDTVNGG